MAFKTRPAFKVLCLGNVLVDILVKPVDALPPVGGLLPVDQIRMAMGGCASNTALALSRLGVEVSLWGKLGLDFFGDYAVQQLRKEGVEVSGVIRDRKVSTSSTVVAVNSRSQRSFLHSVAANDHIYRKDVPVSRLPHFSHLHVGGYFLFSALDGRPMAGILKKARAMGLTTSLDTAWDLNGRWMKALEPCLPYLDYFMPSEREVRMLLGHAHPAKAAGAFLKKGVRCVVIKRGGKGSYLLHQDGREIQGKAFPTKVVDETGAGDCFCAGFLKGLSLQWDLERCLRLGNAAGACAVSALGATAGIRSFRQVRGRMKLQG